MQLSKKVIWTSELAVWCTFTLSIKVLVGIMGLDVVTLRGRVGMLFQTAVLFNGKLKRAGTCSRVHIHTWQ
jgi:hypothetical protein